MLEEHVKPNAVLTKTNAKLSATNKTLTDKNRNLCRDVGSLKKADVGGDVGVSGGGGDKRRLNHCPNCKQDVYHVPNK